MKKKRGSAGSGAASDRGSDLGIMLFLVGWCIVTFDQRQNFPALDIILANKTTAGQALENHCFK